MAYSEPMAETMRADLGTEPGLTEKKMFGGLCFLLHGNMVCGVMQNGAMYRPGKDRESEALTAGAQPLTFTGRPMGGMVELDLGGFEDSDLRAKLTELSLINANSLPPETKSLTRNPAEPFSKRIPAMSYSQDLVDIMRADLGGQDNLSEKEISGALCFLLGDKVVCGVSGDSGFYCTGRWNEGEALALGSNFFDLDGVDPDGLVELDPGGFIDPERRAGLTGLALTHVAGLAQQEGAG